MSSLSAERRFGASSAAGLAARHAPPVVLVCIGFCVLLGGSRFSSSAWGEVIQVKIFVDEEERTTEAAWRQRLKDRVDRASEIINQYANIQFSVSGFGTWNSDNRISDLSRTLREFEQEGSPAPAQLAIGFSSQYRFHKGMNGLGGTRGPMHTHVLVRESSPNTREPERLEALVHELGHYLGAAHTSDPYSVMRPVVGDGLARDSTFRIGFDRYNSEIIRLVGAEMSALGVRRYGQLSRGTRDRLLLQYHRLAKELPKDPAAKRYIQFLQSRSKH